MSTCRSRWRGCLAEGLSGTVPELAGALLQLAMPARLDGRADRRSARRSVTWPSGTARGSRRCTRLRWPRPGIFRLRLSDLRSPVRRRALVTARGVAVYLARHFAGESLEEIGRYFGGRDHTTVMHSCRRTEESLLESDPAVREAIDQLAEGIVENVKIGMSTTSAAGRLIHQQPTADARKTPIHRNPHEP